MREYPEGYKEIVSIIETDYYDCKIVTTLTKTFTYKNPIRSSGDWILEKINEIIKK